MDQGAAKRTRRLLQTYALWDYIVSVHGGYAKSCVRKQVHILLATLQEPRWTRVAVEDR